MLKQRIVTAVLLLIVLIAFTTWLSPFNYSLLITVVLLLASYEWCGLIGLPKGLSRLPYLLTIASMLLGLFVLLGVSPSSLMLDGVRATVILSLGCVFWLCSLVILIGFPENKENWNDPWRIATMGLFTLIPAWVSIVLLKYLMPSGYSVLALIILVAAVDVGAFFAGTNFGKRRLAPNLSPKKSWEGVWGGFGVCYLVCIAMIWGYHNFVAELLNWQVLALLALATAITFFSVIGDLLESMLKRNQGMKDSGRILPGHGGLLDRIDGLIAAAPPFALTILIVIGSVD